MATTMPVKFDMKTGMTLTVQGNPSKAGHDPSFDSYLLLKDGSENHTLTLVLRIFMNPVTGGLPGQQVFLAQDYDKKVFVAKPWSSAELAAFQRTYRQQAAKWNNQFWLVPPAGFSKLNVKRGSKSIRPNIYCHLYIDLVNTAAKANFTLDLINLHPQYGGLFQGIAPDKMTSGSFRSDSGHVDSNDIKTRPTRSTDDKGVKHERVNYLTIVHELGHALGLDHIGVPHGDPMCKAAMLIEEKVPDLLKPFFPAVLQNGTNSRACYGEHGPAARGANVMGSGTEFDETNASPWVERIALHTSTKAKDWTVKLGKVAPKTL